LDFIKPKYILVDGDRKVFYRRITAATRVGGAELYLSMGIILSSSSNTSGRAMHALSVASPAARGVDAAAVSRFLDDVEADGLELHALIIWRDGAVVAEGFHWPYQPDGQRILHSIAKSFTACAIGLLIDEGRLSLHDKVAQFFPHLAIDPGSRHGRMTVEDLLTMRSGHESEVSGSKWRGIASSWVDEFFRIPMAHEPGTVHVYSSAASYMLSAIVTHVTGETIHAYLKPRLFEPLGIVGERWDIGPDGINPGGNGITACLSDAMRLGILHAQSGVWEGQRLLPAWWVKQATRAQGSEAYGYHWVIGAHYFAAIGQFVQAVFVYPEQQGIVAVAAAIHESKLLIPHLNRYFPAAFGGQGSEADDGALAARLGEWGKAWPITSAFGDVRKLVGQRWLLDANLPGVSEIGFDEDAGALRFWMQDREGQHSIPVGAGQWIAGRSTLPGAELHHGYQLLDAPSIAAAWWDGPDRLTLVCHFVESAFRDTITLQFAGDSVTMDRRVNINSAAQAWPTLTGTAA
jgi:CubicO group peptidase (beta-lactamase class C family)